MTLGLHHYPAPDPPSPSSTSSAILDLSAIYLGREDTQTQWKLPMPRVATQCCKSRPEGIPGRQREGRGRPETSRSQRGFRNKVPSPTQTSQAEPQPRVPSKVQQRLCLDFLTGPALSQGLAPGEQQTNLEVLGQLLRLRSSGLCQAQPVTGCCRGEGGHSSGNVRLAGLEHLFWKLLLNRSGSRWAAEPEPGPLPLSAQSKTLGFTESVHYIPTLIHEGQTALEIYKQGS